MKNFKLLLILILGLMFYSVHDAYSYGDGYTDCERDKIYESNAKGHPTMGLRLRKRACMTDSDVILVLPEGETVDIIAETDGWYKVRDKNDVIGWVGARLVKVTQASTIHNRLSDEHYSKYVGKGVSPADRTNMLKRVKGRILLQVESKGEAWYVDPVSEKRFYMEDGNAAYEMLRTFGLGISNSNFEKLAKGDVSLIERLFGRIVLQVEKNGEAHYINPQDKKLYYLKNGEEAYRIIREQGLGISNSDLELVQE